MPIQWDYKEVKQYYKAVLRSENPIWDILESVTFKKVRAPFN
jgi:hypothetical protein